MNNGKDVDNCPRREGRVRLLFGGRVVAVNGLWWSDYPSRHCADYKQQQPSSFRVHTPAGTITILD
jgi:hypothetical protein